MQQNDGGNAMANAGDGGGARGERAWRRRLCPPGPVCVCVGRDECPGQGFIKSTPHPGRAGQIRAMMIDGDDRAIDDDAMRWRRRSMMMTMIGDLMTMAVMMLLIVRRWRIGDDDDG